MVRERPTKRMIRGAIQALRYFGIFCLLILALWLFGGAEQESRGMTIRADLLTLLYPAGVIIAGAVFGLLEPVADRSRGAAMAVGVIALLPWVLGISLTMDRGYADWTIGHTITSLITTVLLGSAAGYGYSLGNRPAPRRRGAA